MNFLFYYEKVFVFFLFILEFYCSLMYNVNCKVMDSTGGERKMILIIAEKPSLARNIMAGIDEKFNKCDGFYAGEHYLVSWAIGHLFSLADIET